VQTTDGEWLITTQPGGAPADLLRSLVGAGAEVHSFEPLLASMEDIFLNVVSEAEREPLA
jgi:hypothetical protein